MMCVALALVVMNAAAATSPSMFRRCRRISSNATNDEWRRVVYQIS